MLLINSSQFSCLLRNCLCGARPPWSRESLLPGAALIQWLINEGVNRPDPPPFIEGCLWRVISASKFSLDLVEAFVGLLLSQLHLLFNFAFPSKDVDSEKTWPSKLSSSQSPSQSLLPDKPTCSTFFDPLPPFSSHLIFLLIFIAKLKILFIFFIHQSTNGHLDCFHVQRVGLILSVLTTHIHYFHFFTFPSPLDAFPLDLVASTPHEGFLSRTLQFILPNPVAKSQSSP